MHQYKNPARQLNAPCKVRRIPRQQNGATPRGCMMRIVKPHSGSSPNGRIDDRFSIRLSCKSYTRRGGMQPPGGWNRHTIESASADKAPTAVSALKIVTYDCSRKDSKVLITDEHDRQLAVFKPTRKRITACQNQGTFFTPMSLDLRDNASLPN